MSLFGLVQFSFQGPQDENVNQQTLHNDVTDKCRNRHNFNWSFEVNVESSEYLERHVLSGSLQQTSTTG